MQFKNLLVAKKIWVLLTVVVVLLLGAMGTMASYMTQLELELREHVLEMEGRSQLSIRLLGATDAGTTAVVTAHFAKDVISQRFFEQRAAEQQQTVNQLFEEIERRVDSAEGKAILDKVRGLRAETQAVMQKMQAQEQRGEDVGQTVRSELTPTVTNLLHELEGLVALQQQRVQQSVEQGDVQRRQALMAVAVAVLAILALAMLLSRWLVRQVTQPLRQAVELADEIAQGNLTREIRADSQDELGMLLGALQRMTERLRSLVGEVRDGVAAVSTASEQIEQGNQNLSTRTEETAANLEETAASIEELTANMKQAADTAQQANQLATRAAHAAERGEEVMHQVVMSMDQINTASRKINDIIGVIDGIAFQTNILALNAAVEAARAGEQGRGFAVVASEVRSLAQRSADAAKEIKVLINTSVVSVEHGAEQVQQAGENMHDIVEGVRRVTGLIAEMSASAQEQRDGISQVNQAINNLDQMTQQNAGLVEESAAAASAMHEQAQRLQHQVRAFRLSVTP